jgi:hypothetical protein
MEAEAVAAAGGVESSAAAAVVTVLVQCMESLDGADTLEAVNDVETKFRLHCPEVRSLECVSPPMRWLQQPRCEKPHYDQQLSLPCKEPAVVHPLNIAGNTTLAM